jgi:hypothetical protein
LSLNGVVVIRKTADVTGEVVEEFDTLEMGKLLHGFIPKYYCVSFVFSNRSVELFFDNGNKAKELLKEIEDIHGGFKNNLST